MGSMIRIRRARPGEGRVVTERIRASLPTSLEGLTIWHCGHVDRWVEERLGSGSPPFFYLAVDEDCQAVGAAEFRVIRDVAFLNQIGVCRSREGQGIGGRLLAGGLRDLAGAKRLPTVALDVEPTNEHACQWYQRLGFVSCSATHWMLASKRRDRVVKAASIEGWGRAEREHELFGFSRFRLRTSTVAHEAGRLGDKLFRLTMAEAWTDASVHAALEQLDPRRRLLLIGDDTLGGAEVVRRTQRLRAPMVCVLSKLPG